MKSLRSKSDFNLLRFSRHKVSPNRWLTVSFKPNESGHLRLGCTIPRVVGTAVTRNRLKRWTKFIFREWLHEMSIEPALDVNVAIFRRDKPDFSEMKFSEYKSALAKTIKNPSAK